MKPAEDGVSAAASYQQAANDVLLNFIDAAADYITAANYMLGSSKIR